MSNLLFGQSLGRGNNVIYQAEAFLATVYFYIMYISVISWVEHAQFFIGQFLDPLPGTEFTVYGYQVQVNIFIRFVNIGQFVILSGVVENFVFIIIM
jgi:hypothetical protein